MLYIYLKSQTEIPTQKMEYLLSRVLQDGYQLSWNQTFGTLSLEETENQVVHFRLSFDAIAMDLFMDVAAIIVPRFDETIEKACRLLKRSGMYPFVEELPQLLIRDPQLRTPLLHFLYEVSDDVVATIKIYLEMNMSVNLVAKTMYTHRNTVNYRISRFIELTGIDIRSTINGYYVYLLITWCEHTSL